MVGQALLPASAGHSCPAESARGVPLAEADKNVCPTEHLCRDMSPTFNVQRRPLSQRSPRRTRERELRSQFILIANGLTATPFARKFASSNRRSSQAQRIPFRLD